MDIVDGRKIDVTDSSWIDTLSSVGVSECYSYIVITEKTGREYGFRPANRAQEMLFAEIMMDLINIGSRTVRVRRDKDEQ